MNYCNKILNYAEENNGYVTTKEIDNLGISHSFLSNLVKKNELERVRSGIYKLPDYPIDNLYILSKISKNMCFSHSTALYLFDMSDRIPLTYDITVPYNYSGNLQNMEGVSLRYVKKEVFELGMIEIKTINDLKVRCYDIDRTICDIIKDKNTVDKEIYSKALKEYAKCKNKNITNLIKYAEKLGVENEVVEIMEVIL